MSSTGEIFLAANEAAQFGCGQQAGIAVHRQITLRSRPSLADSIDSENDTSVNSASNTILMVNPYGFGMPMDLRRLRYFVAVAEARSVGKAAERLRMAQPPLSVQIRKLEAEIGAPLFRRGTHGMDLTEAGQALLARAGEALALAADGAEAARAVASGQRGPAVGRLHDRAGECGAAAADPRVAPVRARRRPRIRRAQRIDARGAAARPQRHRRAVHAGDPSPRNSGGADRRPAAHAGDAEPFAARPPERGAAWRNCRAVR